MIHVYIQDIEKVDTSFDESGERVSFSDRKGNYLALNRFCISVHLYFYAVLYHLQVYRFTVVLYCTGVQNRF